MNTAEPPRFALVVDQPIDGAALVCEYLDAESAEDGDGEPPDDH
ncbi:hypothetical protein B0I32_111294 [Nonomuraea fuscirosea]|uniref:Uncharacterized protein n=1 Tax=Nonomuraea fuscirosea TaxID=1291556 RepID=A0A2T0MWJ9_9ACTN|nr:hypothetical protein B0I32_111294 [Nonomuraea fuscirosea]